MLWEIPAGVSEPGETAADGALRELREETGYRASTMRPLGSMFVTPGYCTERLEFFHADGLSSGDQQLDEDERIAVASFTIGEAERLVETGQIADVKTVVALLWMRGSRGELVPRNGR
jgi:ADP-ribose pyrophosphatase